MCGIIGIVGKKSVASRLIEGLRRVEYRGYDSAGFAVVQNGNIDRHRSLGKISALEKVASMSPIDGSVGIAHTRWASHGEPSDRNAHPHATDLVAIVHNGIIENHLEFRDALSKVGVKFSSETDTESVLHLVHKRLADGQDPLQAVKEALQYVKGAYALGFVFKDHPDILIGARNGCPMVIGYGDDEMYLGSDTISISHLADKISYLQDGDIVVLSRNKAAIYDHHGNSAIRPVLDNDVESGSISKGEYPHYMLKEIHEQPDCLRNTLLSYVNHEEHPILQDMPPVDWQNVSRITMVACGTAYYAALVGKYYFEKIARIPVEVEIASEFRYRAPPMQQNGLSVFVSQSGETADTIAAFEYAKAQGQKTLGIINVPTSALARGVDFLMTTKAGIEIGVASTKAFSNQLMCFALLAVDAAYKIGKIDKDEMKSYINQLMLVPSVVMQAISNCEFYKAVANGIKHANDTLFLGRGTSYAIALEGALKLKELSYIHAEGYSAGEMKHGPIALIDNKMPVIVLAPYDDLFDKTASNVEQTLARHGIVTLFSNKQGCMHFSHKNITTVEMPDTTYITSPIIYSIPVQMLAYYAAVLRDTDVDQPRNLAKSVTIE